LTGSEHLIVRFSEKYELSGLGEKNMPFCVLSLVTYCATILWYFLHGQWCCFGVVWKLEEPTEKCHFALLCCREK